jgi:hypothetical protein
MVDEYAYNADGEMVIVPQEGALRIATEFGIIEVEPGEIAVIPRGVKIRVELAGGPARGYLCENYGGAFSLPERGPIGANCLANPRDFLTPRGGLRGPGRAVPALREMGRLALGDRSRPFAARRGRVGTATTRPTNMICAGIRPSGRSCSTTPTRPSSPC